MPTDPNNVVPITPDVRDAAEKFSAEHARELLTILFTDLVDSTKLQSDLGNIEAARLTELHRSIVQDELENYDAREIDWSGDSCLAVFSKPSEAVTFALRMQIEHEARRDIEENLPMVRIGIHLGEIVVQQRIQDGKKSEDLFGLQVSETARVMSLARGNQIYCTRAVYDNARGSLHGDSPLGVRDAIWQRHGMYMLKGSRDPVEICEVGATVLGRSRAPKTNDKCRRARGVGNTVVSWTLWTGVAAALLLVGLGSWWAGQGLGEHQSDQKSTEPLQVAPEVRRTPILLPETATIAPGGTVLNFNLAISPDGKRVVYRSEGDEAIQLVLKELDRLEVKPLEGTGSARFPFFSPDGKWVGYFAPKEQKLKKVSINGGLPITICDAFFYTGADWGEDGTIVYSNGGQALLRVSADGGEAVQLTTPDPAKGETYHTHPNILPGGTHVLFQISPAIDVAAARSAVLSLDTGEYVKFEGTGAVPLYAPSGHLVFVKPGGVFAQPFDLETLTLTGPPAHVAEHAMVGADGVARHFGFSNDGTLAYIPGDGEERASATLTWQDHVGDFSETSVSPMGYVIPRVSPDGTRVAVSVQDALGQDIWVRSLNDNSSIRLTFDSAEDWHPIWTLDGTRVVFTSSREGTFNLYIRSADGAGKINRLTDSPHLHWPHTWDSNNETLVYVEQHPDTGYDIWDLPLNNPASAAPLLRTPVNENNPDVSADGNWIAYQSNERGQYEIYIQPFPSLEGRWQVSRSGGNQARWAPDGKSLFFRHGTELLSVDFDAGPTPTIGPPTVLFKDDSVVLSSEARNYDIHPINSQFLVLKPDERPKGSAANRELIIVENWFEELRRLAPSQKAN